MRILQLHTDYREPGGETAVVRAEAELLRAAGHDVVAHQVVNPAGAAGAALALAASPSNPVAARRAGRLAGRLRPDLAHVHNTWYALSPSVLRALGRAGVPVVMTLHNYRLLCVNASLSRAGRPCEDCVGRLPLAGVAHRCYRGSAVASAAAATTIAANRAAGTWTRHVRRFLVLNEFARERFVRGGLPAERLTVTPNFVADPGGRGRAPSASPTVLFVGRLEPLKGVGTLLDAWAARARPGLELVVVGDGPMRPALERRAPPGVRFAGRLAPGEVRRRMLDARALAFPTLLYEGQPMVVLEALAAGLPVLASDLGGTAELLRAGAGAGWLAPPGDTGGWGRALARLDDGAGTDAAGRRLRGLYEQRFTPELGLRRLLDVYGQVAATRRVGAG
ncbi:MAG TPA: glycosyltransferase family 4 protein [Actinomycetes bacterium]|nr:glycosyltransferase family 4 protein [Actinomycetes bacterium]